MMELKLLFVSILLNVVLPLPASVKQENSYDRRLNLKQSNETSPFPKESLRNIDTESESKLNKSRSLYQIALEYNNKVLHFYTFKRNIDSDRQADQSGLNLDNKIKDPAALSKNGESDDRKAESKKEINKNNTLEQTKNRTQLKIKATEYFAPNTIPGSPYLYSAYLLPRSWVKGSKLSNDMNMMRKVKNQNEKVKKSKEEAVEVVSHYLHPESKPFFNFTIKSDKILYKFDLNPDIKGGNRYYVSAAVEKMNCLTEGGNGTAAVDHPKLSIEGHYSKIEICTNTDNSNNNYQSVDHTLDGVSQVMVRGLGRWNNVTAHVVVSVYYETTSCKQCTSESHFCCGRKDSSCSKINSKPQKQWSSSSLGGYGEQSVQNHRFRCIPNHDAKGNSLLCNGHPNCGLYCNLDESTDTCPTGGNDDNSCPGYYCREELPDRAIITILILAVFCVFVPFCIFIFFCSRKDLRREFSSGCPLTVFEVLLCPFNINADPPAGNGRRTNIDHVAGQQVIEATSGNTRCPCRSNAEAISRPRDIMSQSNGTSGMVNDLPPSYSECCNNKRMYPSPPKYFSSETSTDFSTLHQNDNPTRLDSDRGRSLSLPQEANTNMVTMHWCTCESANVFNNQSENHRNYEERGRQPHSRIRLEDDEL